MTQWKDISSAPKDGTRILACDAGPDRFMETEVVAWLDGYVGVGWYFAGGEYKCDPTHYIDLPPAPDTMG